MQLLHKLPRTDFLSISNLCSYKDFSSLEFKLPYKNITFYWDSIF